MAVSDWPRSSISCLRRRSRRSLLRIMTAAHVNARRLSRRSFRNNFITAYMWRGHGSNILMPHFGRRLNALSFRNSDATRCRLDKNVARGDSLRRMAASCTTAVRSAMINPVSYHQWRCRHHHHRSHGHLAKTGGPVLFASAVTGKIIRFLGFASGLRWSNDDQGGT